MITEVTNVFVVSNETKEIRIQKSGYYVMSVTYTPTDLDSESNPVLLFVDGVCDVETFLWGKNTVHLYRVAVGYYETGRYIYFEAIKCMARIMIERVE